MKEIECIITGRVQLVMFRDFIERKARGLGVAGEVKNLSDGSVSVVAQGEKGDLETLLGLIKKGPLLAKVGSVSVKWRDPLGSYSGFNIAY